MARRIYTGIDIGTHQIKVVISTPSENSELPMQILGTGTAPSRGLRHGYIVDTREASKCIREALQRAMQAAKVPVRRARIALNSVSIEEMRSSGDVSLTASGGVVTEKEVERAQRESEKRAASKLTNRAIMHTIPLEFRVDGNRVFGKANGMQGSKLSVDTLLITTLSQHHEDTVVAVEASGVEVDEIVAGPLAASLVALDKNQKTPGVVLANIGAETLSIVVYDNNLPVSLKMFPIGSADITNAIALSFQIPLTEAESLKRGGVTGSDVSQKKIQTIIATQLKKMFTLINAHLRTIGRQHLLPAGIVITGGGSSLPGATETARKTLRLPSQIGQIGPLPRTSSLDASWAVAYGLCRWSFSDDQSANSIGIADLFGNLGENLKNIFRSLLP